MTSRFLLWWFSRSSWWVSWFLCCTCRDPACSPCTSSASAAPVTATHARSPHWSQSSQAVLSRSRQLASSSRHCSSALARSAFTKLYSACPVLGTPRTSSQWEPRSVAVDFCPAALASTSKSWSAGLLCPDVCRGSRSSSIVLWSGFALASRCLFFAVVRCWGRACRCNELRVSSAAFLINFCELFPFFQSQAAWSVTWKSEVFSRSHNWRTWFGPR